MKVAIGSDHGGFELKTQLAQRLRSRSFQVVDVGTSSNEAVDYPDFAKKVALQVADGHCQRGIMIDGAGIGSAMVANKVPGVRAALAYDLSSARNSREHNDANLLTLGAGLIGPGLAWEIVELWLGTDCTEDRHLRRVSMIETDSGCCAAIPAGPVGVDETSTSPGFQVDGLSETDLQQIITHLRPMLGSAAGSAIASTVSGGSSPDGTLAGEPELTATRIAGYIDHTVLKPDATADQVTKLCAEAREFGFASVCVNSIWVPLVSRELKGSGVKTCSVVGFPLGAMQPELKAMEARRAIREGAKEIDMVINIGALKRGDHPLVLKDIRAVVEACRDGSAICKVIIETCLLNDDEKRLACRLARQARAHFVKTSTGFSSGGATPEDVALMVAEVREGGMEVKASGGIRSLADMRRMIAAGATRIGASAGVAIVQEAGAGVTTT
jgi:deoxyribose-phosphate aldolase